MIKVLGKDKNEGFVNYNDFGINTYLKATAYPEDEEEFIERIKNGEVENEEWKSFESSFDIKVGDFIVTEESQYVLERNDFLAEFPSSSKCEVVYGGKG